MARRWRQCDRLPQIYFFDRGTKGPIFLLILLYNKRRQYRVDGHPDHTLIQTKDVFDEQRRITCLTLFNLLTLGIAQASLALRSFNRKFQDLSAEKDKIRLAARCWNKFSMTFGGICYLYPHFGKANSILMFNLKFHRSPLTTHLSSLPIEGANLAVEEALNVLLCQSEGSTDICATEAF